MPGQPSLGALNDIAVHQRMVTQFRNDIENCKSEPPGLRRARKLRGAKEFWSWPPEWKMPAIPLVLGSEET